MSKRQRRLNGVENPVSRQIISVITDKVIDGMAEWQNQPLDRVYPAIFPDAIHVQIPR